MKVILLETLDELGRKGEIVQVKNGYARNFLLPRKKAMPVTKDAMNRLDSLRKRFAQEEAALVQELQGVASTISATTLEFVLKATEEGHLFGSVTPALLARSLAEKGIEVEPRTILLEEPIKTVGTFSAAIRLHPDVRATFSIVVDREGGMPEPEPEEGATEEGAEGSESAEGAEETTGEATVSAGEGDSPA